MTACLYVHMFVATRDLLSSYPIYPTCKKLKNLDAFVSDVRWFEETGRKRGTTWGEGKDKVQKQRVQHTLDHVVTDTSK